MNENMARFLIICNGSRSGVSGFWVVDSAELIGVGTHKDYADLWVCTPTPRKLAILPTPKVSLHAGINDRARESAVAMKVEAKEVDLKLRSFAQHSEFVFASNEVADQELPVFLSSRHFSQAEELRICMKPTAKVYGDIPDVRLGITRQRILFSEFCLRTGQVPQTQAKMLEATGLGEWERIAHAKVLPAGLYLPVTIEADGSSISAFLRLESDVDGEKIPATLFSSIALDSVKHNTKISRRASFNYQGQHNEATSEIGIVC